MNESSVIMFEDLPRDEQVDSIISTISGHEKEPEIGLILSVFAAYKTTNEIISKYGLGEYATNELIDYISAELNHGSPDEEDRVWNFVLDSIGAKNIFYIIYNINDYIDEHNKIKHLISQIRDKMLEMFVSKHI